MSRSTVIDNLQFQNIYLNGLRLRVATRPALVSSGKSSSSGESAQMPLPLLVVGGMGADLELLKPFVEKMDWRELILFDAPGVGQSSTPLLPMSIPQCSWLVKHMLNKMGYRKVDVLGLSWGGGLAQQLAYDYPAVFKHLILAATSSGGVAVPGHPKALARLMHPARFMKNDYIELVAEQVYGASNKNDRETLHYYLKQVQKGANVGYYWQLLAMLGWTSIHWLHCITQPTLVMGGKRDPIVPLANARILHQRIPDARLEIVDDGHLFILTKADMVSEAIHAFHTSLAAG